MENPWALAGCHFLLRALQPRGRAPFLPWGNSRRPGGLPAAVQQSGEGSPYQVRVSQRLGSVPPRSGLQSAPSSSLGSAPSSHFHSPRQGSGGWAPASQASWLLWNDPVVLILKAVCMVWAKGCQPALGHFPPNLLVREMGGALWVLEECLRQQGPSSSFTSSPSSLPSFLALVSFSLWPFSVPPPANLSQGRLSKESQALLGNGF